MNTPAVRPRFSPFRLIVAFFGLALLVTGMALGINAWYFGKDAQSAIGTVTETAFDGSDGTSQRPTFLFRDSNGAPHVARTNIASSSYNYAIGDQVPILYNFRVDDEVRIAGWLNNWATGAVLSLIGLFLLGRGRRRESSAPVPVTVTDESNPRVLAKDAGEKKAWVAALLQSASKAPPSVRSAKASTRGVSMASGKRPGPVLKPRSEPTVRRMR